MMKQFLVSLVILGLAQPVLLADEPKNATEYFERAISHYLKGEYDKSIQDSTEAIRLDPKHPGAHVNRGMCYRFKKEYEKAFKDFTEAIRVDPNYAYAYVNRASEYGRKQEHDNAIRDLNKSILLESGSSFAYYLRGHSYQMLGKLQNALADYNEAVRLDAKNTDAAESVSAVKKLLTETGAQAQNADDIETLRRENALLKREIELLKKEIALLQKEVKGRSTTASNSKAGAKSLRKVRGDFDVVFELVNCFRDRDDNTKVTITFSVLCESENGRGIGVLRRLSLTAEGGMALTEGKVVGGPQEFLTLPTKGFPSKFQASYVGVDPSITSLDEVYLEMGGAFAIYAQKARFYNIKIESK